MAVFAEGLGWLDPSAANPKSGTVVFQNLQNMLRLPEICWKRLFGLAAKNDVFTCIASLCFLLHGTIWHESYLMISPILIVHICIITVINNGNLSPQGTLYDRNLLPQNFTVAGANCYFSHIYSTFFSTVTRSQPKIFASDASTLGRKVDGSWRCR